MRFGRVSFGLVALWLAACVASPRPAGSDGVPARPLAAPSAAGDLAVSQVVRGAVGSREVTINAVVSVKGNEMSVVGLNAMGVRLFTVTYDGTTVNTQQHSSGLRAQIRPEWLLADLQFVFWPLASLEGPLRQAGFEISEPSPGTRRLRRGERLVSEAHYAGDNAWTGRSWLVNLEQGYSLQIDSEPH